VVGAAAAIALAGCGAGGPEVRATIDRAEWRPVRIVAPAPVMPGDAVPAGPALPGGLVRPTPEEAGMSVHDALCAGLAASATDITLTSSFSRSETAAAAARAARQYLEARSVDPAAARGLAEEGGADAVLLIAVLRFGPESETEVSTQAKSVNTKVGTTDVGISSAATRVMIWFNAQFRCALVRVNDGAVIWDVGVRRREKPGLIREVSQASVLEDAVKTVCDAFPWKRADEEPAPGTPGR
jgi:hypothetical protein